MDDLAKKQVIENFESAIRQIAPLDLDQALAAVRRLAALAHAKMEEIHTREDLVAALDGLQLEGDGEQLLLAVFAQFPLFLRMGLGELFQRAIRDLPPMPRGRPAAVTRDEATRICEFVGLMNGKGCGLKEAKQRAAQKFGVSQATVQRAWISRKNPKLTPTDMQALVERLLK